MKGVHRIETALGRARRADRLAFIPYITAGDPDLDATRRLTAALAGAGADILELGVPWSDPLADGPVNQRAAERALASGTTLGGLLEAVPAIKKDSSVPIVLFTYFNPILRYGLERFALDAERAGVDGVLVTDLPPEEAGEHRAALEPRGIATIFLATPTSTDARLESIARASSGFVYTVSRTGVTGPKTPIREDLEALLGRLRRHATIPVAVGFGISEAGQVASLRGRADAFVVGSALVETIERLGPGRQGIEAVTALAEKLVAAGGSG